MYSKGNIHYPTVLQAIHLVVLYLFVQTVIDFPLALYDYYKDTELLYNPVKKIVLGIGSLVFILWYGFKHTGHPLRIVFPLKRFHPLVFLLLLLFFLGAHPLLNRVNEWLGRLLPPPDWFWELFGKIFDNDFGFWGAFLKVVVVAPVAEELIFRGVIMHGLMRNYKPLKAVFLSGLLFALFHLNPWQFPATFVLGLILGWLMIRTKNILVCMGGHALNNLVVLLSVTFFQQVELFPVKDPEGIGVILVSLALVAGSVALMVPVTRQRAKGTFHPGVCQGDSSDSQPGNAVQKT